MQPLARTIQDSISLFLSCHQARFPWSLLTCPPKNGRALLLSFDKPSGCMQRLAYGGMLSCEMASRLLSHYSAIPADPSGPNKPPRTPEMAKRQDCNLVGIECITPTIRHDPCANYGHCYICACHLASLFIPFAWRRCPFNTSSRAQETNPCIPLRHRLENLPKRQVAYFKPLDRYICTYKKGNGPNISSSLMLTKMAWCSPARSDRKDQTRQTWHRHLVCW